MKKSWFALFFVLIFLIGFFNSLNLVDAQIAGNIGDRIGELPDKVDNISNSGEYLKQEWRNILLENVFVSKADSFLTLLNPFFVVIFAEDYSFLSSFWFIVIFWFIVMFFVGSSLKGFGFSYFVSYAIGGGVAVILAQLKLFRLITDFILVLLFKPEIWYVRLIGWIIFIFGILIIFALSKALENYLEKRRKANVEAETEYRQNVLKRFIKSAGLSN